MGRKLLLNLYLRTPDIQKRRWTQPPLKRGEMNTKREIAMRDVMKKKSALIALKVMVQRQAALPF
ncbi:MAG: hypothetical protein LAO03_20675 [Acidobacteriia bacterium]|nr:hypothetical protein [Terriglobia bacterium]